MTTVNKQLQRSAAYSRSSKKNNSVENRVKLTEARKKYNHAEKEPRRRYNNTVNTLSVKSTRSRHTSAESLAAIIYLCKREG